MGSIVTCNLSVEEQINLVAITSVQAVEKDTALVHDDSSDIDDNNSVLQPFTVATRKRSITLCPASSQAKQISSKVKLNHKIS